MILGVEAGAEEAIRREGKILAVLTPRVAVDDREGENLLAAIRRKKGIEGLRRLDFALNGGLSLFDFGGFFGLLGSEFGSGEGFGKRCITRQCFVAFGPLRVAWPSLMPFKRRIISRHLCCGLAGEVVMRGVFGEMGGLAQELELLIVVEAGAVDDGFELVKSTEIFIILCRGAGGLDVFEEFFAEFSKADRGAIVGLAFFMEAHEGAEVFGADLLPVVLVIAAGDGEDLNHATVFGDERKNAVYVKVGIVEGGGDVAEESFEFGVADFVFLKKVEEGLFLLGSDFDEIGGNEDLGVVAAGEIGDDLGLTLLGKDNRIVGETGGGDGSGGFWNNGGGGGGVLELVEVFSERRRKFV